MQNTIRSSVEFDGIGLHSGSVVRMSIHPAPINNGIWFHRTDVKQDDTMVPALWNAVKRSSYCTVLENDSGVTVSTVEHVMAALFGCGIYNAIIELNGPEVPILDGSSLPFVQAIMVSGVLAQKQPIYAIKIMKTVQVKLKNAIAKLSPSDSLHIDFHIDFDDVAIGQQRKSLVMNNGAFVRELSNSRTFCRQADVPKMLESGFVKGGCPGKNAVVFDGAEVVSPGGLRHLDEPVRHKMLDVLGDLALVGAPILGRYSGVRAGHALTNKLLRTLFATAGATQTVLCDEAIVARLLGVGLHWSEIPS
ncbi:MAG: UDP-3-O-acyl-N-acetylglucosamine deacetylase [Aestuariivita sp.]|nr:UDP-3-O-acyl-N-acetylglucosamine deacetylase [Aestuariivita sp.]